MTELDWHREMLADSKRVNAFREAVFRAVTPGDIVVDIGTGTGLLALFCLQAGASKVYAIECGPVIDIARQTARQNGLEGRIEFLAGHSCELRIDERADLIVAEVIGSFGLEEEIVEVLSDARARFLKPGGRLLPDALDLMLAPTEEGAHHCGWASDFASRYDLDFSAADQYCRHMTVGLWADSESLLAPGSPVMGFDLHRDVPGMREGSVWSRIDREGKLSGWIGWFTAYHQGEPFISTQSPIAESSWENVFFPSGNPVPVKPGDEVGLHMQWHDPFWAWQFFLNGKETAVRSELNGLPPRDLRPEKAADGCEDGVE